MEAEAEAVWVVIADPLPTGASVLGRGLGGGLLAGLHTGLVVSVDVHQFAIEADGPLEQGDQFITTARPHGVLA